MHGATEKKQRMVFYVDLGNRCIFDRFKFFVRQMIGVRKVMSFMTHIFAWIKSFFLEILGDAAATMSNIL